MFELGASPAADRLDALPTLAQHDRALPGALDVNRLLDPCAAVWLILPSLSFDRASVWYLVMQLHKHLFACRFRRDQTLGSVRQLILRKKPRPRRQTGCEVV